MSSAATVGGEREPVDVAAFDRLWNRRWPDCAPAAREPTRRFRPRWARFGTLPESKRYPTTDAEHAEILRRHQTLLSALLDETAAPDDDTLVAITCSWSATSRPTPRDVAVAAAMPEAAHWRSDDLATEPGFHSWQHHFVSRTALSDPALDRLLRTVAVDLTDGVILTDRILSWLYHPYDGGADVIAGSVEVRDRLATTHLAWLPRSAP
jgi:hypothetical protein